MTCCLVISLSVVSFEVCDWFRVTDNIILSIITEMLPVICQDLILDPHHRH